MKTLANIEEMIAREAFANTDLVSWRPVVELPCQIDLSTIYAVNREFTHKIYHAQAVWAAIYPDGNEWVLQRIHGVPFPNEWANIARPEGMTSLYLEYNEKLKHDRARFSSRDALEEALYEWTLMSWDCDKCYYYVRRNGKDIPIHYDHIDALCTWEHL